MPSKAVAAPVQPATKGNRRARGRRKDAGYVESLLALAKVYHQGGLTPKGVSRPEHIAAILEVGRDVGLPDTQAIANIKIVGGRPSIFGDAGMALIRSSGLLEDIEESYEGEPGTDEYTAVCRVKRVGAKRDRTARFSVAEAKRARLWGKDGPWTEYPERQQMWRARGFATRDEFQDVLCGLIFQEEADDYPDSPRVVVSQPTGATTQTEPKPLPLAGQEAGTTALRLDSSCGVNDTVTLADAPTEAVASTPHPADPAGPVTAEQLARLNELADLLATSRGLESDDDFAAAWSVELAVYGVESAKQLTAGKAATLITDLGRRYDPFSQPGHGANPK